MAENNNSLVLVLVIGLVAIVGVVGIVGMFMNNNSNMVTGYAISQNAIDKLTEVREKFDCDGAGADDSRCVKITRNLERAGVEFGVNALVASCITNMSRPDAATYRIYSVIDDSLMAEVTPGPVKEVCPGSYPAKISPEPIYFYWYYQPGQVIVSDVTIVHDGITTVLDVDGLSSYIKYYPDVDGNMYLDAELTQPAK